jgi:NAD(P)-dependent dehydrogenase (short-subunit alcohol dehydrogenase family)
MDLGLQGKHAMVVGGSRGIGKAIARELAREGVDVALVARTLEQLDSAARELSAETGRRVLAFAADVTKRDQVDRAVAQAAEALGGLDILVNSGSTPGGGPAVLEGIDEDEFIRDFDIKYMGALRCARAALPHLMKTGSGRIINISGTNARSVGSLSAGARNVSLVHLTKTLATQYGRHGITVNCIYPGITRTERTPALLAAQAAKLGISAAEVERRDFAEDSPRANAIGRMVDAREIAYLAAFLASDKAAAITGDVMVVAGGAGRAVYY